MSVQLPPLGPTDGQQFAAAMKKAGTPPQVADRVIDMLKVQISDKNFNFVAGSLRFFSKDELAEVQKKIGTLRGNANEKMTGQLFKKAIDSTSDADIKFALQKVYGALSAPVAIGMAKAPLKFQPAVLREETEKSEQNIINHFAVLARVIQLPGQLKSATIEGLQKYVMENGEEIFKQLQECELLKKLAPKNKALHDQLQGILKTLLQNTKLSEKAANELLGNVLKGLLEAEQLVK